jgi:hypothetical protein
MGAKPEKKSGVPNRLSATKKLGLKCPDLMLQNLLYRL